jgi:hypothetical protein
MIHLTTFVNRLCNEWRKHGKLIIGCDFDDTLKPYNMCEHDDLHRMECTLNLLLRAQTGGSHLIIITACGEDRYPEIMEFCRAAGLQLHSINKNIPGLPYGSDQKPYCNIYLDDRAGIYESLHILERALDIMQYELNER